MGFKEGWAAFEDEVGPALADALSSEAPVGDPATDPDSGTLAGSMDWEDQDGVLTVGSRDPRGPIAAYVVRGTQPHGIDPVNGPFLHFYASDGTEVFARHVEHPGTQPNPFNDVAWQKSREAVLDAFRATVPGEVLSQLNPWRNRTI